MGPHWVTARAWPLTYLLTLGPVGRLYMLLPPFPRLLLGGAYTLKHWYSYSSPPLLSAFPVLTFPVLTYPLHPWPPHPRCPQALISSILHDFPLTSTPASPAPASLSSPSLPSPLLPSRFAPFSPPSLPSPSPFLLSLPSVPPSPSIPTSFTHPSLHRFQPTQSPQVAAATKLWDGTGSFLFTSSMSVCAAEDASMVDEEHCPLVPLGKSPATDRLLGAEKATLDAGGNVLRLVGLYHAQRGPHTFFIKQGEVARYGGYTVNMLHYEDAARLAVAVLRGDGAPQEQGRWRGRVFVGADNHPLTFQEMVDACFDSGVFSGSVKFTATPEQGGGLGKRVNNDVTRRLLAGWEPRYSSFRDFFLVNKGADFYTNSGLF